jgi:hypothetical protein
MNNGYGRQPYNKLPSNQKHSRQPENINRETNKTVTSYIQEPFIPVHNYLKIEIYHNTSDITDKADT